MAQSRFTVGNTNSPPSLIRFMPERSSSGLSGPTWRIGGTISFSSLARSATASLCPGSMIIDVQTIGILTLYHVFASTDAGFICSNTGLSGVDLLDSVRCERRNQLRTNDTASSS